MKSILITGGAGFLGSLICKRLLASTEYDRIIVYSRDWHKHHKLRHELNNDSRMRWFVGDICDKDRLLMAMRGVDDVIHAACIKDILTCGYNPFECKRVNIDGTQSAIEAAIQVGVDKFLFVSTDKAAAAEVVYGSSKAFSEGMTISSNAYSPTGTKFSCVRYGNVLGSSSSAAPLFAQLALEGKAIPITHERMSRFWISPEDAVTFVLNGLREMVGGEIFVPKLPASLVVDLARAVAPNAAIEIVGIRGNEKMHELMVTETESRTTKDVGWSMRIEPSFHPWNTELSYPGGTPVPWGFQYSSASAPRMTLEEIQQLLPSANLRK
jgi:UDP-N-acetylglucosamine 4,6-dehydratase